MIVKNRKNEKIDLMERKDIPQRFQKDYYTKDNSDFVNMNEVMIYYEYKYNIFMLIGLTGEREVVHFSIVEWRDAWYGSLNPTSHPIVRSNVDVNGTNNTGTIAFNRGNMYFIIIPLRS